MKFRLIAIALIPFLISACDEKKDNQIGCSSDITKKEFLDLIKKYSLEHLSNKVNSYEDVTSQIKRSALGNINFNLSQISTVSSDSGSEMKTCQATVSMSVKPETYSNLVESYRKNFNGNLDKELENLSLDVNANVFSNRITYTSQPTDDHNTVFVNINRENPISLGASLISAISIINPIIEKNKLEKIQDQQNVSEEQKNPNIIENKEAVQEKSSVVILQRTVSDARIHFNNIDAELNTLWASFSKIRKKELLPSQRQWIRNKDAICGKISTKGSDDKIIQMFDCQTEMTKERIRFLESY